jgi:AICAR transformylase/IMP cyclohydrolase PurH
MKSSGNIFIFVKETSGLELFVPLVRDMGWKIYSSRRVRIYLKEHGVDCNLFGDPTDCPSKAGGHRVPNSKILAGIMADHESLEDETIADNQIPFADVVVLDADTSFLASNDHRFCLDDIDICPSVFILASVQNARWVCPVIDIPDREKLVQEIVENGSVSERTRSILALKALSSVASNARAACDLSRYKLSSGQSLFRRS